MIRIRFFAVRLAASVGTLLTSVAVAVGETNWCGPSPIFTADRWIASTNAEMSPKIPKQEKSLRAEDARRALATLAVARPEDIHISAEKILKAQAIEDKGGIVELLKFRINLKEKSFFYMRIDSETVREYVEGVFEQDLNGQWVAVIQQTTKAHRNPPPKKKRLAAC